MKSLNYIRYIRKSVLSGVLGATVWTALTTFMIVAKTRIGTDVIPVFEMMIFIAGVVGTKLAFTNLVSLSRSVMLSITIETLFLVSLYIVLLTSTLGNAGIVVYIVIITNALTRVIVTENKRSYEDRYIKTPIGKLALRKLRMYNQTLMLVSGVVGTSIATLFITVLHINLTNFTLVILILNIAQNVYDWYIWKMYLSGR